MSRRLDLVGQRFGRWKVIGLNEAKTKAAGRTYWNCECRCGTRAVHRSATLTRRMSKSCGCKQRAADLTGKTMGRVTVGRIATGRSKATGVEWRHCTCRCGTRFVVRANSLRQGETKSCGCLARDNASRRLRKARRALTDRAEVDGFTYYFQRAAMRYLGVTATTLRRWSTRGCPWLRGRAIRTTLVPPEGMMRPACIGYRKADLKRIRAARAAIPEAPDVDGHLPWAAVMKRLGLSNPGLTQLVRTRRLTAKVLRRQGRRSDNTPCDRTYLPISAVEEIEKDWASEVVPADRLTIEEAARESGYSVEYLCRMAAEWDLDPERVTARVRRNVRGRRTTQRRRVLTVSRAAVARLKQERPNGAKPANPIELPPAPAAESAATAPIASQKVPPPGPDHPKYPGHVRKPYTTGMRPDPEAEEVQGFCYVEYVMKNRSRSAVLRDCAKKFGLTRSPATPKDVANNAKRWAEKFSPPLPLERLGGEGAELQKLRVLPPTNRL